MEAALKPPGVGVSDTLSMTQRNDAHPSPFAPLFLIAVLFSYSSGRYLITQKFIMQSCGVSTDRPARRRHLSKHDDRLLAMKVSEAVGAPARK